MIEVRAVVTGRPVPKARPRFSKYGAYTPVRTVQAEDNIREAYAVASVAAHGRVVKFVGEVEVELSFIMPDRRRSDWDNLAKLVCDALNGVAYDDDSQIVSAKIKKWFEKSAGATALVIRGEEG